MGNSILYALIGTGFCFSMSTLGSAMVFVLRGKPSTNEIFQRIFLGFAAGIMIAASVWSLLIPAIEEAGALGQISWIPAAIGFSLGGLFMLALDRILPHLHIGNEKPEGLTSQFKRKTLLLSAVTLHNIPEGMAVGLSFALAAQYGVGSAQFATAVALAIGIGIQNFPEGAAISLPLFGEGLSRFKSFLSGSMSGIVEPIFGVLTVLVASGITPVMPWLLSFAAGAMIYVVIEEIIPEANLGEHSNLGTIGAMAGFLIMMVLDVAL